MTEKIKDIFFKIATYSLGLLLFGFLFFVIGLNLPSEFLVNLSSIILSITLGVLSFITSICVLVFIARIITREVVWIIDKEKAKQENEDFKDNLEPRELKEETVDLNNQNNEV